MSVRNVQRVICTPSMREAIVGITHSARLAIHQTPGRSLVIYFRKVNLSHLLQLHDSNFKPIV